MSTSPQVFLSYAREDFRTVDMIYNGLKKRGVNIWMDVVDIGLGKWKTQIERAISKSRYFIICISEAALKKTGEKPGFQDEELNRAYNIAENQSPNKFTIIPVRLENCSRGDHRLSVFQHYDLFNDFNKELDKLAVHLGGVSLSDEKAKDNRSKENILINSLAGKALAAYYAGDLEKAIELLKAALLEKPEKPEYHDIENLIKSVIKEKNRFRSKSMIITKPGIIEKIAKDAGITKTAAQTALESFFEGLAAKLKEKDVKKITLVGFGTFEKTSRNSKTVVKFKPGKKLKDAI